MEYKYKLLKATVDDVCNNLLIDASLEDGQKVVAFCGSHNVAEQCSKGSIIWIKRTTNPHRIVKYNVAFVETDSTLIFANPKYNRNLFLEAFENDLLEEFEKYEKCEAIDDDEDTLGVDFILSNHSGERCFAYVTSIYMKRDSYAVFPHDINFFEMKIFEELAHKKKQGDEACVFIIVPREDCVDAKFVWDISTLASSAVYKAAQDGVKFICYSCNVKKDKVEIDNKLDILY